MEGEDEGSDWYKLASSYMCWVAAVVMVGSGCVCLDLWSSVWQLRAELQPRRSFLPTEA